MVKRMKKLINLGRFWVKLLDEPKTIKNKLANQLEGFKNL